MFHILMNQYSILLSSPPTRYVKSSACHFLGSLGGTCRMAPEKDPLRVVDHRLRVAGVDGLRIVDASVMPTLTCGQLNGPVTMIAEKASEMILEDGAV